MVQNHTQGFTDQTVYSGKLGRSVYVRLLGEGEGGFPPENLPHLLFMLFFFFFSVLEMKTRAYA
jgi:hypothetical protein